MEKNAKEKSVRDEVIERTVYMTRDSCCMGDDVIAPNIWMFSWRDCDWNSDCDLFEMLEQYLGSNLPGFYWRGYVNGKRIADVNLCRTENSFMREITLADNWQELLREADCIHFLHEEYKNKDHLPETIDDPGKYYSFKECEEIWEETHGSLGFLSMQSKLLRSGCRN